MTWSMSTQTKLVQEQSLDLMQRANNFCAYVRVTIQFSRTSGYFMTNMSLVGNHGFTSQTIQNMIRASVFTYIRHLFLQHKHPKIKCNFNAVKLRVASFHGDCDSFCCSRRLPLVEFHSNKIIAYIK